MVLPHSENGSDAFRIFAPRDKIISLQPDTNLVITYIYNIINKNNRYYNTTINNYILFSCLRIITTPKGAPRFFMWGDGGSSEIIIIKEKEFK